jgi:hypothetical protein
MRYVVLAFGRRDGVEHLADGLPQGLAAACCGFAQVCLQLAEGLLDRVEIGGVRRQVADAGTAGLDRLADTGDPRSGRGQALVAAEIVEDDDVAGPEGWRQELFDPGAE